MKFNDLYNRVFVREEDTTEVANPEDFQDVDGAPIPPSTSSDLGDINLPTANIGSTQGGSLENFITQIEEFRKHLTDPRQQSLLAVVNSLDKENTPFEGISKVDSSIVIAAKALGDVIEDVNRYLINSKNNTNPAV